MRRAGGAQVRGIAAAVQESVTARRPWQLIVSQTILSTIKAPKLVETVNLQPPVLRWLAK
jgi:hypothetical protein